MEFTFLRNSLFLSGCFFSAVGFSGDRCQKILYCSQEMQCCEDAQCCSEIQYGEEETPSYCFSIGAEWLYMMDSYDQPYYAVKQGTLTVNELFSGDRVRNEQRWHSGYRVEALYSFPNGLDHIKARWTQFPKFTNFNSVKEEIFTVISPPGFITGTAAFIRDTFDFYYLDLLFGRSVYSCNGLTLGLEGGVQFSSLKLKETIDIDHVGEQVFSDTYEFSKLKGIGPELSLDFSYDINRYFSINGRALTAFLINKRKATFLNEEDKPSAGLVDSVVAKTKNKSYWLGSPMFNIRFGVNFKQNFCSWYYNIEAGYEVIHCSKSLDRIFFVDDLHDGASFTQHMDFTLSGLYLGLVIGF